ncbi:hypothetical protein ACLKA6_017778 [Drosophila palustris]
MAWVLRAKNSWLKRIINKQTGLTSDTLTVDELHEAEKWICRMMQEETYAEEIAALSKSGKVHKGSAIYKLSPRIDEDGLLRLAGRIDEAVHLPFDARRPILLPTQHRLSKLIMLHFHKKYLHQNNAVIITKSKSIGEESSKSM